jgi:hypothetical protein
MYKQKNVNRCERRARLRRAGRLFLPAPNAVIFLWQRSWRAGPVYNFLQFTGELLVASQRLAREGRMQQPKAACTKRP